MKLGRSAPDVIMGTAQLGGMQPVNSPAAFHQGEVKLVPYENVFEKLIASDLDKEDVVVPWSDLEFTEVDTIKLKSGDRYVMTELSFSQLCKRLNTPADYMKRCPVNLRNDNLSYWRDEHDDKKVLLRTRRFNEQEKDANALGVVRAVLPSSYEPIGNTRIAQWVGNIMQRHESKLGIQFAKISDESTHIRMLFGDKMANVGTKEEPDKHFFGVHLSDSDVGERSFLLDFVDFRLVCKNGMITQVEGDHLLTQRHIHVNHKILRNSIFESFQKAIDHRDTMVDMFDAAQETEIKDPHSYIRRAMRHYRATNEFTEAVLSAYEREPNKTKYGVIQAITRAARSMSIDSRVNAETLAGNLLLEAA